MSKKVLAICLKTYPDEEDMQRFCDGKIEAYKVKIYHKGEKYSVSKGFDSEYYKLIEKD